MRKTSSIVLAAMLTLGGASAASPAFAAQPGPGDKQCIPGKQGNPHPGFKAGACSNK